MFTNNISCFLIYYVVYSRESSLKDVLSIKILQMLHIVGYFKNNLVTTLQYNFEKLLSERFLLCFCQLGLLFKIVIK